MKRKVAMMGLAMMAGLPHAVYARGGSEGAARLHPSWKTSYMPHYGAEGAAKPLMDHVSVAAPVGRGIGNAWRLEFTPPPALSDADSPLMAMGIRAGFSLNLDF